MKNGANIAMYSGHIQSESNFNIPFTHWVLFSEFITLVSIDIDKQTQILVE